MMMMRYFEPQRHKDMKFHKDSVRLSDLRDLMVQLRNINK